MLEIIMYKQQQNMILVDSIIFLLVIGTLQYSKVKNPNFLFFCKGSILFLPPDEESLPGPKQKKNKERDVEVKILKVQYPHVKDYPMRQPYERVIFVLAALVFYLPLKLIFNLLWMNFISSEAQSLSITLSSLYSLLCLILMGYVTKLGLEIFWISSYNIKISLMVSFGVNLVFFLLVLSLSGTSGIDHTLRDVTLDYIKQLKIVFGRQISGQFLNYNTIVIIILVINSVLGLVCIPAVIKFGNWYGKTLKEIYYEDNQEISSDPQVHKDKQERQKMLKIQSAKTIRLLNIYIVASLIFLFFSHRYSHQFLDSSLIDVLRILLMTLMVYINLVTLKDAIQFNGSFAYKFIGDYIHETDANQRQKIKKRILPYLYLIWYHKFQFMFRIIVPLILFIMLLDWKYVSSARESLTEFPPAVMETHCGVFLDELVILQNLYKCEYGNGTIDGINSVLQNTHPGINGGLIGYSMEDDLRVTQQRALKYGIFNNNFVIELLEILMWYFNILLYGLTIVYILFLRKTVYDL